VKMWCMHDWSSEMKLVDRSVDWLKDVLLAVNLRSCLKQQSRLQWRRGREGGQKVPTPKFWAVGKMFKKVLVMEKFSSIWD